jgi:hypothetical protein
LKLSLLRECVTTASIAITPTAAMSVGAFQKRKKKRKVLPEGVHALAEGKYGTDSRRKITQVWQPEKTGGMPKDTAWAIPKNITKNPPYGRINWAGKNPSGN